MPTRSLFKSLDFQVAASETARAINRRIVLNLIRTHQPIFELTLRAIQAAKETVSVIAEQLTKHGLLRAPIRLGAAGHLSSMDPSHTRQPYFPARHPFV